ncbi:MAG: N-6 DNA methylase [Methyloprofundus sp.]|nr:N-6 DNA methylase [Methyloprofundus sp.]
MFFLNTISSIKQRNDLSRYKHVESRKKEGAHYTPEVVSDFISNKIISNFKLKDNIKIVDPAIGDGELLISLIKQLYDNSIVNIEVYGFDINKKSIEISKLRLLEHYPNLKLTLLNEDFLNICLEKRNNCNTLDLLDNKNIPSFDLLIANPPYIRTQNLKEEQSRVLRENFGLKGRLDIYQAFLIAMSSILKPDGVAGVIVSNRFLTTKGASHFREMLYDKYTIKGIWDFGDTKIFEAAILPAVMVLTPSKSKKSYTVPFSSVYMTEKNNELDVIHEVDNQIEALQYNGIVSSKNGLFIVKNGELRFDKHSSDLWRLQDDETKVWLNKVIDNTWCTFKDIGKIRVGVKTTADNVFIRSNWDLEVGYEPELLKPLITHHNAGRFHCNGTNKKYILYTHTHENEKRKVIDLDQFPLSKKYLESHKEQLSGRKYIIKANRKWNEIWVPQNPKLWNENKIIFRDISKQPMFWFDDSSSVVNGDCYWMLNENDKMPKDILWLVLAIANSKFIEKFYDCKFQNKLYSNRRRFISQYVEQFPVPNPKLQKSKDLISLSKQCFNEKDKKVQEDLEHKINELVLDIFQVN